MPQNIGDHFDVYLYFLPNVSIKAEKIMKIGSKLCKTSESHIYSQNRCARAPLLSVLPRLQKDPGQSLIDIIQHYSKNGMPSFVCSYLEVTKTETTVLFALEFVRF